MSRHIVVVEDDAELLEVICAVLRGAGIMVTGISGSERELRSLLRHPAIAILRPPDAFLIDLDHKQGTGLRIARLLRRDQYGATRMIGVSGQPSRLHEALESGEFHSVLAKPFDADELFRLPYT
jgi:CheY-like chemotaxis protein